MEMTCSSSDRLDFDLEPVKEMVHPSFEVSSKHQNPFMDTQAFSSLIIYALHPAI
jgi:hypothetical protein